MNTVLTRQQRNSWNPVTLGVVAVIVFLTIWLNACSSGSPEAAKTNKAATPASASSAVTTAESVPTSLSNAGEYGENVYDYAKANDWKNSDVRLAALKEEMQNVRAEVKNQSASVDRLDAKVTALDRNVSAKDRQATMREAT